MLELVNLSNFKSDLALIGNQARGLEAFLHRHRLDGVEMMFCGPWDPSVHKKELIHGVHLRFWPSWLDFWRGDWEELVRQFGDVTQVKDCYGGLTRHSWLEIYRENIRQAVQAEAKYLVFHVSHARSEEVYHWQFHATDREVILATIEVINELTRHIPDTMSILFENLWWPGLTLRSREMAELLLDGVKHPGKGIMLDTGHLMNTNQALKTEEEGVRFILSTLRDLGDCRRYIKGMHLHQSLSGEYVRESRRQKKTDTSFAALMSHVMKVDQHRPFTSPEVQRLIDFVRPEYLVHEFIPASADDWEAKLHCQKQAIERGRVPDATMA